MARTASDDERTIGVMRTLLTDEERREHKRLWDKENYEKNREKNREKLRLRAKKYYDKNREELLLRHKEYRAKRREEVALGRLAKLSMAIKQEPMEEAL